MQRDYLKLKPYLKDYIVDIFPASKRLSEEDLLKIISLYDGVICGDNPFTKNVINKAEKLKVIVKWGTGVDSIDVSYAEKKGIKFYNTPNAFTEPVSDTVLGFILSFARNISFSDKLMKKGKWEKMPGFSLSEKTLGIIGLGNIGNAVARKAKSFGMKVIGYDNQKVNTNIEMTSLSSLIKKSDFISLNCSLNKSSYHLITSKELKMMNGKYLINTSRGTVIKEEDLIKALEKGILSGAGLDVFEIEPLPKESKLRKFDNVLLSSHNSNSSPKYFFNVHLNSIKKLNKELTSIRVKK
jgi:phosphoglycerate dehydrogenase-like enzyme